MPADKTSRRTPDDFTAHLDRDVIEVPDLDLSTLPLLNPRPPVDPAEKSGAAATRKDPAARGRHGGGVGRGRPAASGRRYAFRRS